MSKFARSFLLRLVNLLLALVGLAMIGYAVYMFVKFKHTTFEPDQQWMLLHGPGKPRKAGFPW